MLNASWIEPRNTESEVCPIFLKKFVAEKTVKKATLKVSARGVYEATLNGQRVGNFILAPGWTCYRKRFQVQEYDITDMLKSENVLTIQLAKGWYSSQLMRSPSIIPTTPYGIIAEITIEYTDGSTDILGTDESWLEAESPLRFCEIYDGIIYDANFVPDYKYNAVLSADNDKSKLVAQQGEYVTEQERLSVKKIITTPKGETVLDFGQNMTGYLEITVNGKKGDKLAFSFGEILDKDGNFYNENYRKAKCLYEYTCRDGYQTYKPNLTFYGFRYVRLDSYPYEVRPESFTAIVLHSVLKRTGNIKTSSKMLNQLFSNIIWGQKSNYLDIPTDCPQRNERLGWTGDAQVFIKAASYNYDVKKFFKKWLADMKLEQLPDGGIPRIIPNVFDSNEYEKNSAAWSDAVCIIPWELYLVYGDKEFLTEMFEPMKKWVGYITSTTEKENLWFGGDHYGDWLELKAKYGEFKGETRDEVVSSAFYAYSTELVCKAGRILGEDVSEYEELHKKIVNAFIAEFNDDFRTQTEHLLPLRFGLCKDPQKVAKSLVDMIHADGDMLQTGFVGTPHLLHVLSDYGYTELAYKLLLREEYPSWLYPITKGATTMWEHWDGIKPDGSIWPVNMNSYNHYAYGAVADWMYGVCAGIKPTETAPGYKELLYKPVSTDKLDFFEAEFDSPSGKIISKWHHESGKTVYELTTPVPTTAIIEGKSYKLGPGEYTF